MKRSLVFSERSLHLSNFTVEVFKVSAGACDTFIVDVEIAALFFQMILQVFGNTGPVFLRIANLIPKKIDAAAQFFRVLFHFLA